MKHRSELSEVAEAALHDLFLFCNHFVGLTLEEVPHREMCDIIQRGETDRSAPNVMLVVPRGTYKSSIAIASVTWKMLRQIYLHDNPYHRIVLASATLALGKSAMTAIEGTWRYGGKNQRIDEEYGKLWANRNKESPGSRREDGLVIAPRIERGEIAEMKEPTVFIGSMRRISTGFHADEAIIDDLNNRENTATDHQIKQTHEYYRLLYPILGTTDRAGNPSKMLMLCTPWADYDVRGMIIKEEELRLQHDPSYVSKWSVLQRGAINEDGSPFFPTKYPLERLSELREAMGTKSFSANYLCNPIGNSGFVEEDQIRFKSRDGFPSLKWGRICVDPNQHNDAKELGCYAAIIVAGYDVYGKMYVLDARGSREWDTTQFISALFDVQEAYPYPIFMEDSHMTHFQAAVALEETRRSDLAGELVRLRINYVPVDYKSSKYERWQRLQPRFNNNAVFFADDIAPSIKTEIKDELVRGEVARFKDFIDALAMCEIGFRPRVGKDGKPREVVPEQTIQKNQNPNAYTFADALGDRWKDVM